MQERNLKQKLHACAIEVGVAESGTLQEQVTLVAKQLGLQREIDDQPLMVRVDICHAAIFSKVPIATGKVVTDLAVELATPVNGHVVPDIEDNTELPGGSSTAATGDSRQKSVFDTSAYPNGGPRGDQNLPCLTVCCAAPFVLCPTHCLSAWGCTGCIDGLTSLPCQHIPCSPCDPNSKNPLWFCAEPLGWASSFGQLHTVMALVKNGAVPETKNGSGNNAYTDAEREGHRHVLSWLAEWEAAGRPRGDGKSAPSPQQMAREDGPQLQTRTIEGCYIGACIVPILVTAFWVSAQSEDEITASGLTLPFALCPWSYRLTRASDSLNKFLLPDPQQDWTWHKSGCSMCATPGWWALKIVPSCS